MQSITVFKTSYDCKLHNTQKDAINHLDKIYGDKLSKIGHALVKCDGKYTKMCEFLEHNLSMFVDLAKVKADMVLQTNGEENAN